MQISWKKECAVAMTAILCCSILPEWIPFSVAAAVSYPVQEIRIGVGDTDRNLLLQQFFKNAGEVWASSPHLRSKLNSAICFSAAIAFLKTYKFAID